MLADGGEGEQVPVLKVQRVPERDADKHPGEDEEEVRLVEAALLHLVAAARFRDAVVLAPHDPQVRPHEDSADRGVADEGKDDVGVGGLDKIGKSRPLDVRREGKVPHKDVRDAGDGGGDEDVVEPRGRGQERVKRRQKRKRGQGEEGGKEDELEETSSGEAVVQAPGYELKKS